jgi:hypothetical protein
MNFSSLPCVLYAHISHPNCFYHPNNTSGEDYELWSWAGTQKVSNYIGITISPTRPIIRSLSTLYQGSSNNVHRNIFACLYITFSWHLVFPILLFMNCLLFVADNKGWRTKFCELVTVQKLYDGLLSNQGNIKCDVGIMHLLVTVCNYLCLRCSTFLCVLWKKCTKLMHNEGIESVCPTVNFISETAQKILLKFGIGYILFLYISILCVIWKYIYRDFHSTHLFIFGFYIKFIGYMFQ